MELWERISIARNGRQETKEGSKPGPKVDPDQRAVCSMCNGPIYRDEKGSRCPDCLFVIANIELVHREQMECRPYQQPLIPWQNHRDERDQIPELDEPVLYGLLTRADIPELDRRRAMLAKILTETVNP